MRKSVVDVGKAFLDIYIYQNGIYWQEKNNTKGIKKILKRLSCYKVERLVVETTGHYEFQLAEAAHHKKLRVYVVKQLLISRYAGADQWGQTPLIV